MLSIEDLQDDPITEAVTATPAPVTPPTGPTAGPEPLVPGSSIARALYLTWSGAPVTVVDSPPGAGKSTLITQVTGHLSAKADMAIAVATPTRRQAVELALRISAVVPKGMVWLTVKEPTASEIPHGRDREVAALTTPTFARVGRNTIAVGTVASFKFSRPDVDLLIVDEAYQCTYADVLAAAPGAMQLMLVGDPGQIGPVITINTAAWDHMERPPHARSSEVFSRREDAELVNLPCTYRFGADTVHAIAPLYDFTFASARARRDLSGVGEIESIELGSCPTPHDISMLAVVAGRAVSMIGRRLSTDERSFELKERHVAVVVSHNAQVGIIKGHLAGMGFPEITVGTADKMQGGQWEAVIALDPLAGASAVETHSASLGRLCVIASRHKAHLTFIHDGRWRQLLETALDMSTDERERATSVRERLTTP